MRRLALLFCSALVVAVVTPSGAEAASVARTWAVGNEPFGVTVDPRDGAIYVAVSNAGGPGPEDLYVIDPAGTTPTRIALPAAQVMSVLDTSLDRLFMTLANGSLAAIDVPSRTLVATIPNAGMLGAALDPTTHAVYAALAYGGIAMTDGATGTVLHRASASGDAYWSVALDVSRQRLYATNANLSGPTLVAFDARDLTEIGRVALPEIPRLALAVDAARGLVYVSGFNTETGFPGSHLYAVDETSLTITNTIDVGLGKMAPHSMTFDPATGVLYVSDIAEGGSGELVTVDAATFSVTGRSPLPWQPGQSAVHPDGHLYVSGFNARLLAQLSLSNSAPTIGPITFTPPTPTTASLLTANAVISDPDGDPLTIAYEWSRNGTPIADATGPTLDLSQPGHGDRGDTVAVRVTASDGQLTATQSGSVILANAVPALSVALSSTAPLTNDVLVATATAPDADGDQVTLTYAWSRNGSVIAGANGTSLDLAQYGDRGDVVTVTVAADDAHGGVARVTASATVADSAPSVTLTISTTSPKTNDTLVATAAWSDPDGDAVCCAWYFKRNGIVVWSVFSQTGGTIRSFDLSQPGWGDRGDTVTIEAIAGDGKLETHATASAVIVNSPPVGGVALSDYSPSKKDTLVAYGSVFDADGDGGLLMTYTWKVGAKVRLVVGPTATATSSFDLHELQPGDIVTVTVTPTSDGYDPGVPASATAVLTAGH